MNWIWSTSEGIRLRALEKVKDLDKCLEKIDSQKSIINNKKVIGLYDNQMDKFYVIKKAS